MVPIVNVALVLSVFNRDKSRNLLVLACFKTKFLLHDLSEYPCNLSRHLDEERTAAVPARGQALRISDKHLFDARREFQGLTLSKLSSSI